MNYQTVSNLQLRPLLIKYFHCIRIDLRDVSGEKTPFVTAGITRLAVTFIKTSNIHFQPKKRYKVVASNQVEIAFDSGFGRQCGWGFGALAQVFGRTAIPFFVNISAQLENASLLTCWNLLCQEM